MFVCRIFWAWLLVSSCVLRIDAFKNSPGCSTPSVYFGTYGEIRSHSAYGTNEYPPNLYCEYEINAPEKSEIEITVLEIDIEGYNGCDFDHVSFISAALDEPYQLCGQGVPKTPFMMMDSVAKIRFVSDAGHGGGGFRLTYRAHPVGAVNQSTDTGICGFSLAASKGRTMRAIGGQPAAFGQWPWMVSLRMNGQFKCGATLLDPRWLLTAAHCFRGSNDTSEWSATVGDYLLGRKDQGQHSRSVSKVHVHPRYKSRGPYDFDMALVKLENDVTLGRTVKLICLPNPLTLNGTLIPREYSDNGLDQVCYIAGWGRTEYQEVANELHHLALPLLDLAVCNTTGSYTGKLTDSMLCAGYLNGGRDACRGDSGGPLMCQNRVTGQWYQLGIISFGIRCAESGIPGIYSRVASSVDWINSVMRNNST